MPTSGENAGQIGILGLAIDGDLLNFRDFSKRLRSTSRPCSARTRRTLAATDLVEKFCSQCLADEFAGHQIGADDKTLARKPLPGQS